MINGTCCRRNFEGHVTGTIRVASVLEANGGLGGYNGGKGGDIKIYTESWFDVAWSHDVELIGYQNVSLYGGDGSWDGGRGGCVELAVNSYLSYDLVNELDIMAGGGDGASGLGGSGGCVNIFNNPFILFTTQQLFGTLTNSGAIDVSDGDGVYGVRDDWGQYVYMTSGGTLVNSGAIMATGGNGSVGGCGGEVDMESYWGDATNSAQVNGSGGAASGYAGCFYLLAQGHFANSGSLYFDGGSPYGEGGYVELKGGDGDDGNTAPLISVVGDSGIIIINLVNVTPADKTLP